MSRRLPFLLLLLGLLLVGLGLGRAAWQRAIADPGTAALPESIAGLPLLEQLGGAAAAAEIAHLHGQVFPHTAAAVGVYGDDEATVTLWVSDLPLGLLAARLESAMTEAIATRPSPFTPEGTRTVQGKTVYVLGGLGQRHFYFRRGNTVVWLAASEPVAGAALEATLRYYAP